MINFLHTYHPEPILISLGPIHIYWYGVFIIVGILTGILIILKLAEYYRLDKNAIIDEIFWLILIGIIGARIYHIFLEWPFYSSHPLNMLMVWRGGLAIHGAIIAGLIMIFLWTRKQKINFWLIISIYAPALALAQAIGRWGNYFNQELFGLPTNATWGIPIEPANRVAPYFNAGYFHPTFLYESIGNLLIFLILIYFHYLIIKKKRFSIKIPALIYFLAYSVLRFSLEFIRIDTTPVIAGLRLPQITSLIIIIAVIIYVFISRKSIFSAVSTLPLEKS